MIIKHAWGLLIHPIREWEIIRDERCTIGKCYLTYLFLMAAIPTLSTYYGTTTVGWQIGQEPPVKLTSESALWIAAIFYPAILVGVFVMGRLICWLSRTYGATPPPEKCVTVASYTATPLFLAGFVGLYPTLWVDMLVGLFAVGYTIYLLYAGMPIVMNINKEKGFLLSSAVLTVGLVMLVAMVAITIVLWSIGAGPVYQS